MNFLRSGWDGAASINSILRYDVLRRADPLPGRAEGWDFVGSVPAHGDAEYNALVPTIADSTVANGMNWSVYLVRAVSDVPQIFADDRLM